MHPSPIPRNGSPDPWPAEAGRDGADEGTQEQDAPLPGLTATRPALQPDTSKRLPWSLAILLIGGVSLGLWAAIWRGVERLLAG
jgi:hypothetical protein